MPSPPEISPGTPEFPPPAPGLEILYEDDDLLAINKQPWLLSVPGRSPQHQDSAATRAQDHCGEIHVVHRLDCATSGVMIFAKHKAVERALHQQFRERQPQKIYVAIGYGSTSQSQGSIDLPLITDWPNRPRQKVDMEIGKPALTHYRVDKAEQGQTRMILHPITGRSHQLRVHMLHLGIPIIGDRLYAPPEVVALSPRLLLHAEQLTLQHPSTADRLHVNCPAPF